MKFKIKSRYTGAVLYSAETDSLKLAVELAVKSRAYLAGANLDGANLAGAYLAGAYLDGAYLAGAYLAGAYLAGANLDGAYLDGAYLDGAYLDGANLDGASLIGAKLSWSSHALLAECLKRAAGDDVARRSLAGLVAISTDWCWEKFLKLEHPLRGWALEVLAGYVVAGDDAPEIIRKIAEKAKK